MTYRLKTGDRFQCSIAGYEALSDETRNRHVIVRSKVTGEVKVLRIDCEYKLQEEKS